MKMAKVKKSFLFLIVLIVPLIGFPQSAKETKLSKKAKYQLDKLKNPLPEWHHVGRIRVDSFSIHPEKNLLEVFFSSPLSYVPIREQEVVLMEKLVKNVLGRKFRKYNFDLYADHHLLKELIPNPYRKTIAIDSSRISGGTNGRIPIVWQAGKEPPLSGLYNQNIAIWNSHGWYYESKLDRWEWQRARLFGTVEDIYTMSYVLPYIVPMLENSGASVFLPRERDLQPNEIVVDNDRSSPNSEMIITRGVEVEKIPNGFILKDTLFSAENPFRLGTALRISHLNPDEQVSSYIPFFNEKGRYAVYITYQNDETNLSDVKYSVYHAGGKTDFLVNQKIGGGTWIYLGTFDFNSGKHPEMGMITVSGSTGQQGTVSLDAVKFGGGMGHVARRPSGEMVQNKKSSQLTVDNQVIVNIPQLFDYKLSGKASYLEGSRYYLQGAGFPDSTVYNPNKDKNDYNDDYQSRGLWVNYLIGKPSGPVNNPKITGLKIPIDLSFAFHTDAGITPNDSIIGTLGIYSSTADKGVFPNMKSRMSSRDLSDLIQTQIVDEIRLRYNPNWTRRGLWDKQYSEAYRPNVPAMLLELFSHQNIADIKFGLDPRFRFDVSRSIYKGMLKFLAYQNNRPYVVQPLPVDHFSIERMGERSVSLSWQAVNDPLEQSSKPLKYKVYQRLDDNGFDNGTIVSDTVLVLKLDQADRIYSFKVSAVNDGGESFSSEILAVGIKSNSKGNVLVVNGFDRICGPSIFDNGTTAGVAWWKDQGVADRQDISFVGYQYDFDRKSKWLDDDSPGWGASYGDMEGKVIPGNTFDYPLIHGKAIMASGYSFVSTSDEVFCKPGFNVSGYFATDLILGEERSTPGLKDCTIQDFRIYTPEFKTKLESIIRNKGNLLLSGSYIGSEFGEINDTITAGFVKDKLHFTWRTSHAVKGGKFYATDYASKWLKGNWNFNTGYDPAIYSEEAPDGIEPDGKNALTAFRYGENNVSAGVIYNGDYKVVAIGMPFETVTSVIGKNLLMQQILNFFELK
ncbi:MAG: fibronectin type III domain-containing protein [Mariniphaga sp.]